MNTTGVEYDLKRLPRQWLDDLKLTPGSAEPLSAFEPVLALTITREADGVRQVLACVRDAAENRTHPGVLSSPTVRLRGVTDISALVPGKVADDLPVWLTTHIDRLVEEKLSAASEFKDLLVADHVQVWQAHSVIGIADGQPVTEPLTMINVHLTVPGDGQPFPEQTVSYSWIGFVPESHHAKVVESRDASILDVSFDGETPLVYGLCTHSTAEMLETTSEI
jgi:hypothetical protein